MKPAAAPLAIRPKMPPTVRRPCEIIPRALAYSIIQKYSDTNIVRNNPLRWNRVCVGLLQRHSYRPDEFEDFVWEQDIRPMCSEPFKYHIRTWSFICDEYFRRGVALGIQFYNHMTKAQEPAEMTKYDFLNLDDKYGASERETMWIIHLDDLVEALEALVEESDAEEEEDEPLEALEAYTEYQNGKSRDDISDAEYDLLASRVEMWLETQGDIARGK